MILRRFIAWCKFILFGEPPMRSITAADCAALADDSYGVPPEGWFLWEADQYRRAGGSAFWFDPWRYGDADPSRAELVENYERSLKYSVTTNGKRDVEFATAWVATLPNLRSRHSESPDPIGWCLKAWRAAGKPRLEVPPGWLSNGMGGYRAGNAYERARLQQAALHSLSGLQAYQAAQIPAAWSAFHR